MAGIRGHSIARAACRAAVDCRDSGWLAFVKEWSGPVGLGQNTQWLGQSRQITWFHSTFQWRVKTRKLGHFPHDTERGARRGKTDKSGRHGVCQSRIHAGPDRSTLTGPVDGTFGACRGRAHQLSFQLSRLVLSDSPSHSQCLDLHQLAIFLSRPRTRQPTRLLAIHLSRLNSNQPASQLARRSQTSS